MLTSSVSNDFHGRLHGRFYTGTCVSFGIHVPASSFCAPVCVRSLEERNRWRGQADSPFVLDRARAHRLLLLLLGGGAFIVRLGQQGVARVSLVWFVRLCCACETTKGGLKNVIPFLFAWVRKEGLWTICQLRKLRLVPDGLKLRHWASPPVANHRLLGTYFSAGGRLWNQRQE